MFGSADADPYIAAIIAAPRAAVIMDCSGMLIFCFNSLPQSSTKAVFLATPPVKTIGADQRTCETRFTSDLVNAETAVSLGGIRVSGHLKISAPAGFGRRHVVPLVESYMNEHPDVRVTLDHSLSTFNRNFTRYMNVSPSKFRQDRSNSPELINQHRNRMSGVGHLAVA